jgi:thymidylate synthase
MINQLINQIQQSVNARMDKTDVRIDQLYQLINQLQQSVNARMDKTDSKIDQLYQLLTQILQVLIQQQVRKTTE